jgi:hypothetical protein
MPELNDKAYNTLNLLRHTTFLNDDEEILTACQEVAEYLENEGQGKES